MSKLPPGLVYLTIYNPTLRPIDPASLDDDDAGELAQILFYTARDRAVSRDKMLRQIGLAKALVNFSSLLDPGSVCENVHSQARRMIMLSPEQNFWIHACVEVAKTPRPVASKAKGKGKAKDTASKQDVSFEWLDGSVRDIALRTQILRGYEQFKLLHGSFASIRESQGQQALELQLERFFTVWAWKWDLEDCNFSTHLGVPLHPFRRTLSPVLDEFESSSSIPVGTPTFALVPPYVVPSANSLRSRFPPALYQHIMSRVPPPLPSSQDEMVVDPDLPDESSQPPRLSESDIPKDKVATNSASVHKETKQGNNFGKILNVEMRNRKWAWPGYLTFGKSGKSSSQASSPVVPENVKQKPPDPEVTPTLAMDIMPAVDKESLQDAISSHHLETPLSSGISPPPTPPPSTSTTTLNDGNAGVPFPDQESEPSTIDIQASPTDSEESSIPTCSYGSVALPITESEESNFPPHEEPAPSKPKPPLFTTTVHLADDSDPTATIRKKVLHITAKQFTLAMVVDFDHDLDPTVLAEQAVQVLERILDTVISEENKFLEASIPTVSKILEPKDRYLISQNNFTISSSSGFTSQSEHLFNGQQILQSDFDVLEVLSRGQNPQHWHLSRRGLGTGKEGSVLNGEVFMEIARKESTLSDVDNELVGIVKRFVE